MSEPYMFLCRLCKRILSNLSSSILYSKKINPQINDNVYSEKIIIVTVNKK